MILEDIIFSLKLGLAYESKSYRVENSGRPSGGPIRCCMRWGDCMDVLHGTCTVGGLEAFYLDMGWHLHGVNQ